MIGEGRVGMARRKVLRKQTSATFEAGTIGRIILLRGLQYYSGPTKPDPLNPSVSFFPLILIDRDGREFIAPFQCSTYSSPDSLETVLEALAVEALDLERADGKLENYAEMLNDDPGDPALRQAFNSIKRFTAKFRTFLGEEAFEQLLEIVNERRSR